MGLFLVLLGYLSGSLIFGEIVARLKGVDLRSVGSGNVGATNVTRALGKKYGILVFLLDALKGFLPVYGASLVLGKDSPWVALTGLAAVVGHMYPLFFGFKGGKGVATAFGVLLGFSPAAAFLSLCIWAGVLLWKRYVSLASMVSALGGVFLLALLGKPLPFVLAGLVIALLIIYRHGDNINRLLTGREPKV
ncbi:MAG: glycerol-3-phosphate 1-O-acyltransferase PlsY [Aquificae bacterium]|nr:glycerol-3-phosphate 1-O-acyltransferase PlsY [Aquificota bacterium]